MMRGSSLARPRLLLYSHGMKRYPSAYFLVKLGILLCMSLSLVIYTNATYSYQSKDIMPMQTV
jgi:hypothetical protein